MSFPPSRKTLQGLYIILDPYVVRRLSLVEALKEAAAGGAMLFQYRDKTSSGREVYREAEQLQQAARDIAATLIVNDRCDVALAVEADGVHLGQSDLPLSLAKGIIGPNKLIGISTHTVDQVREAAAGGADYVGFGPIFPTTSKADHEPAVGVEGLRQARMLTPLPMFAIGGLTVASVEGLIQAGADGIAVMSAVWAAPDIATAVHVFIEKMARATRPMNG